MSSCFSVFNSSFPVAILRFLSAIIFKPHDSNLWNCRGAPDETTCLTSFFRCPSASTLICMKLFNVCANKLSLSLSLSYFVVNNSSHKNWISSGNKSAKITFGLHKQVYLVDPRKKLHVAEKSYTLITGTTAEHLCIPELASNIGQTSVFLKNKTRSIINFSALEVVETISACVFCHSLFERCAGFVKWKNQLNLYVEIMTAINQQQ